MAIEIIREIFPGAEIAWERTSRVSKPMMTVAETNSGKHVLTLLQRDMSDDFRGPGVDELQQKLMDLKKSVTA